MSQPERRFDTVGNRLHELAEEASARAARDAETLRIRQLEVAKWEAIGKKIGAIGCALLCVLLSGGILAFG